ncbi:hypothetical protein OEA41_010649 [Lepraria neglecta]|uniref:Rhodopsin domain-containing protein n=1 Tax=Lepraria neglecta TaxID=209136 RepID=A0AAD9YZH1_9LECA|nr:hypothetical protein OEA41_010649 [Lepraria neglecta]
MALVISFGISNTLVAFLICRPFEKNWDLLLPGVCGSTIGAVVATSIVNVTVDLIIIILPMPMIWQLQMAVRRKIALTVTFGLGFIVCIIKILRIVLGAQIQIDDFTYDLAKLAIVTDLEPLLGITIACLPLFPPTFNRLFGLKKQPDSRNVLSSSLARLRSRRMKNSAFGKFDDSYPLTDIEGLRTQNHITGLGSKPSSVNNDEDVRDVENQTFSPSTSTIKVKQDWEVRSDKVL